MGGGLIFYVVRIYGTSIIEFVIGVLSRVNGLGGYREGHHPIKVYPLTIQRFRKVEGAGRLD